MGQGVLFIPSFHECADASYHQITTNTLFMIFYFSLQDILLQRKYKENTKKIQSLLSGHWHITTMLIVWNATLVAFLTTHYQNRERHFVILFGKGLLCLKRNKNLSAQGNTTMDTSKSIFQPKHSKMLISKVGVFLVSHINQINHHLILLWES